MFQSLSRDSGRLNNAPRAATPMTAEKVSIPQSGFGAFEPAETGSRQGDERRFQSLSRDSGRLNQRVREEQKKAILSFNPSVGIRGV